MKPVPASSPKSKCMSSAALNLPAHPASKRRFVAARIPADTFEALTAFQLQHSKPARLYSTQNVLLYLIEFALHRKGNLARIPKLTPTKRQATVFELERLRQENDSLKTELLALKNGGSS